MPTAGGYEAGSGGIDPRTLLPAVAFIVLVALVARRLLR